MKKYFFTTIIASVLFITVSAQTQGTLEGKAGNGIVWTFDGHTLSFVNTDITKPMVVMPDYDVKNNPAPWMQRQLPIKKVYIGEGITNIGACAFAKCSQLETVEFQNEAFIEAIGWGAFLRCKSLFNFSMPPSIKKIGKAAFAECSALRSVTIPKRTRVEDYAFLSCTNLNLVSIAINSQLGKGVFATEVKQGKSVSHIAYNGEIRGLPANVNENNCLLYGLSKEAVSIYLKKLIDEPLEEDIVTSEVDNIIPTSVMTRNNTYALIIGNQRYRFAPDVPYARHDATVFAEYCKKVLGIPTEHIHLCLDATKTMILEQELEDWLGKEIKGKETKDIIVYYAGHGVPDINEQNKSYLLPTDVLGTTPTRGIALERFYATIGSLGFQKVTVFMDACFSGINRLGESVNYSERGVEVAAADTKPTAGNMVVFCAAQGNETAQGYQEEGHGLFTYYLLKELQETGGQVTYGKLARKLQDAVSRTALSLEMRKKQTPTTKVSDDVEESWSGSTL